MNRDTIYTVIQLLAGPVMIYLAAQIASSIFSGYGSYFDLLTVVVWVSAACLMFPPLRTSITEGPYRNIFWSIFISSLILNVVVPYLRLAWVQYQGTEIQDPEVIFHQVYLAANKYCKEEGQCADSFEQLFYEGYLPLEAKSSSSSGDFAIPAKYSRLQYLKTGTHTCVVSYDWKPTFGPSVSEPKKCASYYLF